MARARKTCSTPGCPQLIPAGQSRCTGCQAQAEQRRGTSTTRGYGRTHRRQFRDTVLTRDPICVLCQRAPATVADHYPLSRRDLVDAGLNPDDPQYGRGLCHPCHSQATAQHQPGGWNRN